MSNPFFDHPVINSPYKYPSRHWELDDTGQPTQKVIQSRRGAKFISPIPKPRKHKGQAVQTPLFVHELSTQEQEYDHTALINAVRQEVDKWRRIPNHNHLSPSTHSRN
jgi:type III restriction enzyme